MPLRLNVGASKKVGETNYGSRGASVNIELELDSTLVSDPPRFQERIRQLFGIVRSSLAEELNGNGHGNGIQGHANPPATDAGHPDRNGGNGNGNGNSASRSSPPRPATQSQVKAIYAIARSQRLNINQFVRDRFHVGKPEDLSIKEASAVIDELKSAHQGREGG